MKTYSTSQIAKIVGVHPNTVRMYEEWELIQKPERKANGYRVFTDIHIDQFHLAKLAFKIEVLQAGLRKKIIQAVKYSAKYQFDDAIQCVKDYIDTTEQEMSHAVEATQIISQYDDNMNHEGRLMKRAEVAENLRLTIDTIRNWEMNGLIKVKRKDNGYRVYDENDVKRLKIIRSLRCANYSLSAILRMLNALDEQKDLNVLDVLNTPNEYEDIILACDRLIISLKEAKQNAEKVLDLLVQMKNKY